MWEYRAIWPSKKPAWWDKMWERGERFLTERGEKVEERPDTYVVLPGRVDVGLKLRSDTEFEVKALHARQGSWELWEKVPYFKWNSLEVVRFANMLRVEPKSLATTESLPMKGAEEFLRRHEIVNVKLQIRKRRIQSAAGQLLAALPTCLASPWWLGEIVEIQLPDRDAPIFSLCLETLEPLRGGLDPFMEGGAILCGYPEILARHLNQSL